MNEQQFSECLTLMEGYWPGRQFPANLGEVWWPALQREEKRYVAKAIERLARDTQWLPSFAQITEAIRFEKTNDKPRRSGPRDVEPADAETRERWARIISARTRKGGEPEAISEVLKRHYTRPDVYIEVVNPQTMLRDAEERLAETTFTRGDEDA